MKSKAKICCSCGELFTQGKKCQRMCLDCRRAKSVEQANRADHRRRGDFSRLDVNIRAADAAGMSYGKYMASQYIQTWKLRGESL